MEYVYMEKLKGEEQVWRQLLHSMAVLNDIRNRGFLGEKKMSTQSRTEGYADVKPCTKAKNQNTSPYLIDENKGDVVMRQSGFMNSSSETKARILLAELFIKPLKTARCQSKQMVFEIAKETLPLSRSLFTLNATKQFPYAEISKHSLILLQGPVISLGGKVCHSSFEFYGSVLAPCKSSTQSTKGAADHRIKQHEDYSVQERRPG